MKFKCIAVSCLCLLFMGHVSVQAQKVSFDTSRITIKAGFGKIEQVSNYKVAYNSTLLDPNKIVVLSKKKDDVFGLLSQILQGTDCTYELKGNYIIIKPKTKTQKDKSKTSKIRGQVKDITGDPAIGATVVEKGNPQNGVVTNVDGYYEIEMPTDGEITISYIGCKPQTVSVKSHHIVDVRLEEDKKQLDEVVVVGYGVQKKADLTDAVANINSDKLATSNHTNVGQALQGKIAGVDVVSQGGEPGSGARIMVRGIGTLNNASPLYIVDGMYMSGITHINPNDIESIDVLKDASSAAIYGSRAANGVIIITTKSGSNTDGKPIFDFSANMGIQTPAKYLNMLNAEEWSKVTNISRASVGLKAHEMSNKIEESNDWQRIMMKPALMQNYNITARGGSKHFTYYTSLGYVNQKGIIKGTGYERYNIQLKSQFSRGLFTLGNNVVLSASNNEPLYPYSRGGYLGIILQSIPSLKKFDASNEMGGYGKVFGDATDIPNPLGIADQNITKRTSTTYNAFINLYAEVKLPLGLKYRLNVTPDFAFDRYTAYENEYDFGLRNNFISNMYENRYNTNNFLIENLLTFNQSFGEHKISAVAGYSFQSNTSRFIMASGKKLPKGIYEVGATTQDRLNDTYLNESAMTSIISRINYSYKNRYLLTATYRRDGSSKFIKNHRYGHFPSISIGWNVAEENFMANTRSWLDQLKFRGGYGVLGNQEIANYMYSSVITSNINYPNGKGGLYLGAFPKDFANPAIRWESTAMTNMGVDLALLNSRLTITADWYKKKTKDILLTVPIPISTGGANDPVRNAGRIENSGMEWTLNWTDRIPSGLNYGITLTGSSIHNKVVEMGDANQVIQGGTNRTNVPTTRTLAGYPIGGFWLIPTDGLFQSEQEVAAHSKNGQLIQPSAKPGDIRFKDTNNDGKISDEDRVYCGSPFPSLTMGLNINASYKGFDILLSMQSVFGNKIYNATRLELEGVNKGTNFLSTTLDYWTPENRNATHPRLVWDDPNQNSRPSSNRYLENGSFFRLRTCQVGYTFPNSWFNQNIQKLRAYFSMENLFTITNYSGYTPDVNYTQNATSRGFDNFVYPTNRVFMLGINLTF